MVKVTWWMKGLCDEEKERKQGEGEEEEGDRKLLRKAMTTSAWPLQAAASRRRRGP